MAFSISGTVYTDAGVTTMGSGRVVTVSVNGAAATITTTTAANGTFTLSGVTASALAVLTVYLQGNTEVGVAVLVYLGNGSTNVSGMSIYQDYLLQQTATNAGVPNGANWNTSDNNGDSGITAIYSSSSSSSLTTANGKGLYVKNGAFTNNITALSVGGNFIFRGTTMSAAFTTTYTLTGTGSYTLDTNGVTGPNWTINASGGTYTLGAVLVSTPGAAITITAGTLDVSASNYGVTCGGNWSNSGTFNPRAGTVTFRSSGSCNIDIGSSTFNNVVFTASSAAADYHVVTNDLVVNGTLSVNNSGGATPQGVDSNGKNITVAGLMTLSGGTYRYNTGINTFNGGFTQTGGTVEGTSGASAAGSFIVIGDFISSGTSLFRCPTAGGSFTVTGAFTRTSAGSFIASTGTVRLNGSGDQTISGSSTFNNLVATGGDRSIKFTDGTTQTIGNSIQFEGTAGHLLTLTGTSTGGWTISLPATQTFSYLNVSYSTATTNTGVAGSTSTDGGNNTNWTFGGSVAPVEPGSYGAYGARYYGD